MPRKIVWLGLALCASGVALCASMTAQAALPQAGPLGSLVGTIWRLDRSPSPLPKGSIYVFLPSGTLLESSCGEPYRIALWKIQSKARGEITVVEDGHTAFTARVSALAAGRLGMQQRLLGGEGQELELTPLTKEFVCPDLPR